MENKGTARYGNHRGAYEKNRTKIIKTQTVCGICGRPVDKSLKYPHPMSATVDHIIPLAKGGHPSDIDNMQLAHWTCNRQKSDKIEKKRTNEQSEIEVGNFTLPWSRDWTKYRG